MLFLVRAMQGKILLLKNEELSLFMLRLSQLFLEICRLKSTPQQLPQNYVLLIILVVLGVFVDSILSSFFIPEYSFFELFTVVTVYNPLLLLAVYFLLKIVGYKERAVQSLTAIAGTGLCISLFLLPASVVLNTVDEAQKSFALLIVIDNAWRIAVNAHIFRHALSIGSLMAMVISIAYLLFGILVAGFLLPLPNS